MIYETTLEQICWEASKPEMELVQETKDLFAKLYTEAVVSKMMWNKIEDEYRIRNTVIKIPPRCMRKKSLRAVLEVLKRFMEGIDHVHKERKYDSESDEEEESENDEEE